MKKLFLTAALLISTAAMAEGVFPTSGENDGREAIADGSIVGTPSPCGPGQELVVAYVRRAGRWVRADFCRDIQPGSGD